ncbi:unnamed protein product [Gongylonema pulchrum]|uniref:Filamin-A n=1 Tax=Gongylonema pulchrum TaxID=637853 RepID=A0A183EXC4_9BILA|nr:unnamed protein product [Gongylonema pulchrum]
MEGKELWCGCAPDTSSVKIDSSDKTPVAEVATLNGNGALVKAQGDGLHKFVPGQVAMFSIDTSRTGENILFVGVLTTKGPCEEVNVKHVGNGHYAVRYLVQENLKGFIFIKYGDVDIPGSPFAISA